MKKIRDKENMQRERDKIAQGKEDFAKINKKKFAIALIDTLS